ncbi:DUF7288 family protein [Haloarchaeobius sp. HRN-SO-5]|uniref:DUF7288 family protein n=1 Tax=Haloarchaeobius sp. HRN-SO-5 TaxID=3446118 RepID=UPI003EB8A2DA
MRDDERSQAYTLEGFIGSILILTAVLFALQSVVILPTTSGQVGLDVQEQLRSSANDVLAINAEDGSLSCHVRYWNGSNESTFAEGIDPRIGYGPNEPPNVTACDADGTQFGPMLNQTFGEQGREYNVLVTYRNGTETEQQRMVYRGVPTESAVTATYTVTLYDDQRLTGEACRPNCPTLANATLQEFPIPNDVDGPVYNVVVVRVILW